jgi:hypothetical protein
MKDETRKLSLDEALVGPKSHRGATLCQLSDERPTLVVFLRHNGCAFCRETLHELSLRRSEIGDRLHIAIVLMGKSMDARLLAERYGLEDVHRFVDPECQLHDAFSVPRGDLYHVIGPHVWWRGLLAAVFRGHGIGRISGDVLRLPGAFVIHNGSIVSEFNAEFSSDCPDFAAMTSDVSAQ